MNAVFTVSTPNYLGYSISLFNSLRKHNNEMEFYIVLFRPAQSIDETLVPSGINLLYIDELGLSNYVEEFVKRFPINKACMAFKPIAAQKILNLNPNIQKLIYFDSDILVFNSLQAIWNDLDQDNIVLTAHLLKPLDNDAERMELRMLSRAGVFNTGFFALKRSEEAMKFLEWWFLQLSKYGLWGDQVWLNFAPTFFNIKVSRHLGYNVAFYNLPNRTITFNANNNKYMVNDKDELIFYHYIKHNPFNNQNVISSARLMQKNLTFENFPVLKPIFAEYKESLIKANFSAFKTLRFQQGHQPYFRRVYVNFKHQLIRVLYKIIFDTVSL